MNILVCNGQKNETDTFAAMLGSTPRFDIKTKTFPCGREGITVKVQGAVNFVLFRDISHIEVKKHTMFIRLMDGSELAVYSSFWKIAAELLKDRHFIQCHRSFLVNMADIKTLKTREIVMHNGATIPISRGYSNARGKMIKWMFLRGET